MTDDGSVLGNLPRSRPGQRSQKRDRSAAAKPAPERGPATDRPATGGPATKRPANTGPATQRPAKAAGGGRASGKKATSGVKATSGERVDGDPVGHAIRATAKLAGTGARVAGGVAQEVLRRIPRP